MVRLTSGYNLQDLNIIELRLCGVEAYSYLAAGENLHEPLRRNYLTIIHDYPDLSPCTVLSFSDKVMNEMIRKNGLVPTCLIFEVVPRFPILSTYNPKQKERIDIFESTPAIFNSIMAERKIMTALFRDIPRTADKFYKLGETLLAYSEKEKKSLGKLSVIHVAGSMITV